MFTSEIECSCVQRRLSSGSHQIDDRSVACTLTMGVVRTEVKDRGSYEHRAAASIVCVDDAT